jgi:hypothetical protein
VFPKVRPDEKAGWSAERGMFVTGRELGNPDPNFASAGLDSKSLTGKHGRLILCDDLHDAENAGSILQCDKVIEKWYSTILGRADPRGARYMVAGRRWNQHDILAHLKATEEYVVLELPAERENTQDLWVDVTVPENFRCCFTDHLYNDTPPKKRVRLHEGRRERVRL